MLGDEARRQYTRRGRHLRIYRREVFSTEILDDLRGIFASVCADFEAELVEFEGEVDQVHLLVNYPPKISVSSLANSLKGVFSG